MTLDGHDARLELPLDQYQRYQVASELVVRLGVADGSTILDVGGGPGFVEAFLPGHEAIVVDVEGKHPGRFVIGSGAQLPFPDRCFDAVMALDTLEHVPATERPAFLLELQRMSDLVILSAPFADPLVDLAEAALLEFVVQRFGGHFDTLEEHSIHGLPELEATRSSLGGDGWAVATLPSGFLPRWLAGMLLHHELLASGMTELPRLHAYYNAAVSPLDCRSPSYRQVLVAARSIPHDRVVATVEKLRGAGSFDEGAVALRSIMTAVFSHRISGSLRSGEIANAREESRRLAASVAERDGRIAELHGVIEHLELELAEAQRIARRSISGALLQRYSDWRSGRRK